ncbi:MAG: hypothetical protein NZ959_12450, partial [Armatimonadetes bacterium]|nr:hypothetical protein [Armatimonadota bacterium]MDW8123074.1 CHASE4 domain-containing protein [Armatimonadota bacterium]
MNFWLSRLSLKWKAGIVIFLVLGVTTGALYALASSVILRIFQNFEEREARRNLDRVAESLSQEIENLAGTNRDWAAWDDSYQFMADLNQDYIRSNLVVATFINNNLDFMGYVDLRGRLVKGAWLRGQRVEERLPEGFLPHIGRNSPLISRGLEGGISGFVLVREGLLLVSAHPILTSNSEGPARGVLVWGRFWDADERQRLSLRLQIPISLTLIGSPLSDAELKKLSLDLVERSRAVVADKRHSLKGHQLIRDLYDRPVAVVTITMQRPLSQASGEVVRSLFLAMVLVGIALMVSVLFLNRLVISPVQRLNQALGSIQAVADRQGQVLRTATDELDQLAQSINSALNALQESERQIRDRERRLQVIFSQVPGLVWTTDASLTITSLGGSVIGELNLKTAGIVGAKV